MGALGAIEDAYERDVWARIDEANRAAGWFVPLTVAERDQAEALADELNRELFGLPRLLNTEEIIDLEWRYALKDFWEDVC